MASSTLSVNNLELSEILRYNEMLFKKLLQTFTPTIPAVELLDYPCINALLTAQQMQRVRKKDETEGAHAAARELLDLMHPKPGFFSALLTAMEHPSLKLEQFIPHFMKIRDNVDKAWVQTYNRPIPDQNLISCTDGFTARAKSTVKDSSGAPPKSDFKLPLQVLDRRGGYQVDAELEKSTEQELEKNNSVCDEVLAVRNISTSESGEQPMQTAQVENYIDATSGNSSTDAQRGVYSRLNLNPLIESPYTGLYQQGLCVDATPVPSQPKDDRVSSAHVAVAGGLAEPSRDTHPSLKNAISNKPEKDFSRVEVVPNLCSVSGWHDEQVEQKVIQIIKPHRQQEGSYIIWYWAMAKRPTICAVFNKKVITFVVHKTSRQPVQYFINKNQRRDQHLKALVEYHIQTGIEYKPPNGNEVKVYLTHPISEN